MRTNCWVLMLACVALTACGGDSPTGEGRRATAALSVMSGDAQEGVVGQPLTAPLVVRAVDADGRPVAGQLVNFRVTAGGGSVFAGSAITNAAGVAQERWTLGPTAADTQRVEARAIDPETGAAIVFAQFKAVGRAAPTATLTLVSGSAQSGPVGSPLADSLVVEARDRFGNRVAGATVSWTVTAGGGTLALSTTTTDASGRSAAHWILGMRLDATHGATATIAGIAPVSFTAVPTLPASAVVEVAAGHAQSDTVGQQLPAMLAARVRLASGASVIGATVSWNVEGPSGTALPAAAKTDDEGIARASWTLGTTAGTQYVRASTPGTTSFARFAAVAVAGPLANFTIVRGNGQLGAAGSLLPESLVVRAADQYGNVIQGRDVQWAVTSGGGSVAPRSTTTDSGGFAAARWTLGAGMGEQTAAAAAFGVPSLAFTATASPGTGAYSFARVAPSLTPGTRLHDVWASGSSDVYVVGDSGLVLHFDGTAWSRITGVSSLALYAVSGSSPSHVLVAGAGKVSMRFDGTLWARVPDPNTAFRNFTAVHVLGPTFAVGVAEGYSSDQSVLLYDGSRWAAHPQFIWYGSAANPFLCPIFTNVFAISGSTYWVVSSCSPKLVRWDGGAWTKEGDAAALWGISETDYFVALSSGVYRRIGGSFALSLPVSVQDIHGSSTANVFAGARQLHHFDGAQWSMAHDFAPDSATDIWVVSDREVYVLTTGGQLWRGRR